MSKQKLDFWQGELKELKCRAERLVQALSPADADLKLGADELRQELQTANVELEMQCEELQRSRQELEKSQQYLSDIFEQSPIGYLIVNDKGVIRSSNRKAAQLFDMKKELLQNQRLSTFIPPSDLEKYRLCFERAQQANESHSVDVEFRVRQGNTLYANLTFFYLNSTYDNESVLVCAMQDRSAEVERQRLQEERSQELEERVFNRTQELERLNERLRQEYAEKSIAQQKAESASRIKAKFLAAMSHDIRTPLSGVSMAFQVLEEMDLVEEALEVVRLGGDSTQILHELINQVLDYSRLEAGGVTLQVVPFHPHEHFQATVESIRTDVRIKGLELEADIASSVPSLLIGDPLRFKQILLNLLSNATKYTDKGKVEARLDAIDNDADGRRVCLELVVKDSGIGIPAQELPYVFEAFRQVKDAKRDHIEGSGLGLAIVKELAEVMGGGVDIQSIEGQGTEVRCRFWLGVNPCYKIASLELDAPAFGSGEPKAVLLVEDNHNNAKLLQKMLTTAGFSHVTAHTGQEALDLMQRRAFDLVLMDINLPDLMGPEVLRRFKAARSVDVNRSTPIVALTAYAMKNDREKYLDMGFDGYITKPVQKALFFEEIGTLMTQAQTD